MNRKNFFLLCLVSLVLFSVSTVNAASSNDFVKLEIEGIEVYTHKDLIDSRYLVASDSIFYGSSEGQITMKLYLSDKISSGDYKIGLKTNSKNITIKSIGVGKSPSPVLSSASKQYDYPEIIQLNNNLTEVTIVIEFDAREIGLLEEFDVILYNDKGDILVVYDPFISGFSFRQKLTLDTTQLSGNVTADHSILVYVDPTNTDFWTGDVLGTGNGIQFTGSNELTPIDFNVEAFDNSDNNAWFWVEVSETFTSGSDLEQWMYYGGADTDFSDGSDAYPSTYTAVYHLQEPSGTLGADSTGNFDLTHVNTPTLNIQSQVDKGVSYVKSNSEYSTNATLLDGGYSKLSASIWVRKPAQWDSGASVDERIFSKDNFVGEVMFLDWTLDGSIFFRYNDNTPTQHNLKTANKVWLANTWYHIVATLDSTNNLMKIYVNGDLNATLSESMTAVNTGTETDFFISSNSSAGGNFADHTLDEFKIFDGIVLTADEAKLLFLSESNQLITFGAEESILVADFTVSLDPAGLDPSVGVNTVVATLTDTSSEGSTTITDWNYFVDDVQFFHSAVDGDTTREFTVVGDFNVSLIITGDDDSQSQKDITVVISQLIQDIDINFSRNDFSTSNADITFGVSFTGTANAFNWGFPGDENVTTRNANKTFSDNGTKTVCVTIANSSDINKTVCGNFLLARVLTRIPLDAETFAELTDFSISAGDLPFQSYSGLNADSNVYFFDDSTSFNASVNIDFNSGYFPTSRTFAFNSSFFDYQAYLVENDGDNLEATIFTINNPKGRVTVGGIRIDSFTDINGVSTLVESKFSDGTGQAIFHFVKGQEYTLKFFDSDGVLLMSQTIEANNLNYFAYLELGTLDLTPTTFLIVAVDWNPLIGNVIPDSDGNVSFWQLLRPQSGTIGDVNVFISHISDLNIIYNQVFTVNSSSDFNLSFDLNVAGFDDVFPLKISLQIFDDGSNQIGSIRTNSYSFKDTGFAGAVEGAKDALGQFGVTLIALIVTVMIVGFVTSRAIGEDMNIPAIGLTLIITLLFGLIGWIPWDAFASGILFGIGMGIWGLKK